ncbi:UxaA family hydrolase [Parageobacillus thermoglucosidasius]|uniref:UxaA family hydrolase n=1 Tax=Parageobacillus thermoglucosidasius TaxID=1426 RepID=UPI000E1A41DF|nr:altronate dehydratase family protein [Parageobacillus thermoglucosidasius]RDE27487.1 altronate dehydratase [Parageobacillus thermoglucosidasius]
MKECMVIHEKDNVAVALRDLNANECIQIQEQTVTIQEPVPKGHKVALRLIKKSEDIIKYGFPIGHATEDILPGQWVHIHNTKTNLEGIQDYQFCQRLQPNPFQNQQLTFRGYKRKNGKVGIRNGLWVVPTVGCVNGIAEQIIKQFSEEIGDISPFDHTLVIKHQYGCSQLGDDHQYTRAILSDIIQHPNAGGVLVLGLGCENNSLAELKETLDDFDEQRVKFLNSQDVANEIEAGVQLLKELYEAAKEDKRQEVPLSELKIGLKCGGSDGFSGITANPLLGKFSDFLVAQEGTTVLTEVPEMFGAETILMQRAINQEVFEKIVHLINDFKQYFLSHNQPIYENPSPGNKAGGITTLEDKSLGCTQKAGTAPVVDVLKYGERIKTKGLNLLSAPGNDLVASTALAAAGCHMVLFTTGRGTPFGTFVPTVKISTTTELYQSKRHWIDFNAGSLLEGHSWDKVLSDFISYVIQVANGEQTNNEKSGFREIAIWKMGVTL